MHPAIVYRWKCASEQSSERHACGRHEGPNRHRSQQGEHEPVLRASEFGVRRPLRYMAHKLDLDQAQITELAHILNDLKTERAQSAVDHQRSIGAIADALEGEVFDEQGAQAGLLRRVESAQRLRDEILRALKRTHALLNDEQRRRLAYMLRSGTLTI